MNGCSAIVTRCQCCLSVCGLLWPIETRRGAGLVQSRLCICVCQRCYWHLVQTSRRWRTHLGQLSSAMPLPCTILYSTSCEWVPRTILQVCFLLSLLCMVVLLFTSVQLFLSLFVYLFYLNSIKEEYLYSAVLVRTHILKALRHGSHSFTCKFHHACQ